MSVDFDRLARNSKDAVYRQMIRLCGDADQAEDALAEALVSAYRAIDQLDDPASFQAWLAQIARRSCGRLKHREKMRPVLALSELPMEPGAPATQEMLALESEAKECLLKAFSSLEPKYADVYRLRDIEERTTEETALILKISASAVKSRLHRARSMVRQRLDESLCAARDS